MKRSSVVRAVAVAGIAAGLGAFGAPAAFGDVVYSEKGDVSVQNAEPTDNHSPIVQSAMNEVHLSDVLSHNALAGRDNTAVR